MSKNYTYTDAGVNRGQRVEAKKELTSLRETYRHIGFGGIMHLPYSNVLPIGEDRFLDLQIEGVGTKVLIAELADKYDTIGIDAVAMVVNDVIRSGAKPLALADNIHAAASVPKLVNAWLKGIIAGAEQSECPVVNGETGDVAEIIKGLRSDSGFDMVVSCVGQVERQDLITGRDINPGDAIIGLASSGLHSNGITLARKILFKAWGGKYEPNDVPQELSREIVLEALEPTKIYVQPFLKLAREVKVKAAVHITGDSYTKFNNLVAFSPGIGFCFDRFAPQPIFGLIQKTAAELGYTITDEEMFKTFNMGWGFGIIVDNSDVDAAMSGLEQCSGFGVQQIGRVTDKERVVEIEYGEKRLVLL
ncbi:phosphoribosylformylglycinamidine cyclo-ligase [Candidatus Bathycorpusculum sp.]|jgi:phosphoribosylformylglycinamidine cyclo-ligase|uniref:phosphoribosylformylglycinamidine cyclo-ligase n=1 Tax=Candidatus Bathycorpusculum sp. TaxID=2994959 RepID=UPI0028204DE5|nr:phosphoribosylformylglycinamidine cyclo-ligase [Candidatus Termitimicrobium sp.]MCL2686754.1 phosphoribosylformylglycinamidine cyclo-ligase [Candidatus Termitimicrobium sp.]